MGFDKSFPCLYFIEKAGKPLSAAGLQLPGGKRFPDLFSSTQITERPIPSGYVHNINDNGSPVKGKFKKQTETLQFKRRFGDSEVMDADEKPLVVLSTEKAGSQHSGANSPGLTRSSFILFILMTKASRYSALSTRKGSIPSYICYSIADTGINVKSENEKLQFFFVGLVSPGSWIRRGSRWWYGKSWSAAFGVQSPGASGIQLHSPYVIIVDSTEVKSNSAKNSKNGLIISL